MGLFGKITQGLIDTALIPLDIAKDVATLGGASTEQEEPYTLQKARRLKKKAEDIYNDLDDD